MDSIFIIGGLMTMIILFLLVGIPTRVMKIVGGLVVKMCFGAMLLFLLNIIGQQLNIHVPINAVTVSISGFLGVPGVIALAIIKNYFIL